MISKDILRKMLILKLIDQYEMVVNGKVSQAASQYPLPPDFNPMEALRKIVPPSELRFAGGTISGGGGLDAADALAWATWDAMQPIQSSGTVDVRTQMDEYERHLHRISATQNIVIGLENKLFPLSDENPTA